MNAITEDICQALIQNADEKTKKSGEAFFKDPVSYLRIFFLALLIGSILGLKLVSIK
jgi:hypothetical protein